MRNRRCLMPAKKCHPEIRLPLTKSDAGEAGSVDATTPTLSENAPDHRVYAGNGNRYEVGAGWSQVAKSSGETYLNLKIGAPEFGPNWVCARLVKLETPGEDGTTHIALWEPRDR